MSVTLLVLSLPPSGSPHLSPALLWCTVGLIPAGSGFLPCHLPPVWVRSVEGAWGGWRREGKDREAMGSTTGVAGGCMGSLLLADKPTVTAVFWRMPLGAGLWDTALSIGR